MFELCLCLGCEAGVWSLNNAMWGPSENAGDKMRMAGLWEERINLYIFPGVKFWKDFTEVSVTSHVDYFFIVDFTGYFQYRKVKIEKQLNVMLAQRLALFLVNAESWVSILLHQDVGWPCCHQVGLLGSSHYVLLNPPRWRPHHQTNMVALGGWLCVRCNCIIYIKQYFEIIKCTKCKMI